jgi:hypothetical protein
MTFPHPDVWLRSVLDQKLVGSDWHFVFDDFQEMIRDHGLCFYAERIEHWALPDEDREGNAQALGSLPLLYDVVVRKAKNGTDATAITEIPISMRPLGSIGPLHYLQDGCIVFIEIGGCPGSRTYDMLSQGLVVGRYPYEIPGMKPHFFLLYCPGHLALREKQTLRTAALHPRA